MRIDSPAHQDLERSYFRTRPVRFWVGLILAVSVVASGAVGYAMHTGRPQQAIQEWMLHHGYLGHLTQKRAWELPRVVLGWARGLTPTTVPTIHIDVKFRHMQRLWAKREEALSAGVLIQGSDDLVPATIRIRNRTLRTRIRLKGDWVDHLTNNRWAFRVRVRDGNHLFGMRRFSLHHPRSRDYHGEPIFNAMMRSQGIAAPRYLFVKVLLNGDDIGMLALEEHFSKELLEDQDRREGVILRFDESMAWTGYVNPGMRDNGVFNNYRLATVRPFRSTTVVRSPRLTAEFEAAVGLLRAFALGKLPASDVFDVELLGRFIAIADLWDAPHALRWHNLRFYYNPITSLLEPIPFDAMTAQEQTPEWPREPIVIAMLADPSVRRHYRYTLEALESALLHGGLGDSLRTLDRKLTRELSWNYPLIRSQNIDRLPDRIPGLLERLNDPAPTALVPDPISYPRLARHYLQAFVVADGNRTTLEVTATTPQPVILRALAWISKEDSLAVELDAPLQLPGTPFGGLPTYRSIPLPPMPGDSARLAIEASTENWPRFGTIAGQYFPTSQANPIPQSTVADAMARHPFLEADQQPGWVQVRPGRWLVDGSLVLPEGTGLRMHPATTLEFAPQTMMLVRGPTLFHGTAQDPIVLRPAPTGQETASWQGVVVLGDGRPSSWQHVEVRQTSGIARGAWTLTGGVTLYRTPATLRHSLFDRTEAEDALNVIQASFVLDSTIFRGTRSDAFDADYADGVVAHSRFSNIGLAGGGDGVDVSGSIVEVNATQFHRVSDKAISVGERSRLTARDIDVVDAAAGMVSKDASEIIVDKARFRAITIAALMAYVKKPEYGPARLRADHVVLENVARSTWIQDSSSAVVNGIVAATEPVNVDSLYDTTMLKGQTP